MNKQLLSHRLLLSFFLLFAALSAFPQFTYNQYFDGADTSVYNSLFIELDSDSQNVWQVGPPQKTLFNAPASVPNAIVTDTVNFYPSNNLSKFRYKVATQGFQNTIMALQWKQKIDLDKNNDGAIVEYSTDGSAWSNVMNNPYVYNYYGFDPSSADTLVSGEYALSGTDTAWRDVWLCFDVSYFSQFDTIWMQYTLKSDSVDNNKEGWMIDNITAHTTIIHTAGNEPQAEYMRIYPTITSGIVYLEGQKLPDFHIIEQIELIDLQGKVVQRFGKAPVKFYIDISGQPEGMYFLKVRTNIKTVTHPVMLSRKQ